MRRSVVDPQWVTQLSMQSGNRLLFFALSFSPRFSGVKVRHDKRKTVLTVSLPF